MKKFEELFENTDFVHWSGSEEELRVAEYLQEECRKAGVEARIEGFRVPAGKTGFVFCSAEAKNEGF